jgi:hypothetical protein
MKDVANSLLTLNENKVIRECLDRSYRLEDILEEIEDVWAADLTNRKPAPVYTEGIDGEPIYCGTDLDLYSIVTELAKREAVINIPKYTNMHDTIIQANRRVISKENRHGQIIRVDSNKSDHKFSLKIIDYNVVMDKGCKEEVGAPTNFTIIDPFGNLYKGLSSLDFKATPEEEQFFKERKLYTLPGKLEFEYAVHPTLYMAAFGSRYLIRKALSERAEDERAFYAKKAKELRADNITLGGLRPQKPESETLRIEKPDKKEKSGKILEAKLLLPEYNQEYPLHGLDENQNIILSEDNPSASQILRYCENRAKKIKNTLGPIIRSPIRAVELALKEHGFKDEEKTILKKIPWGIPKPTDYKIKRTEYNAVDYGNNIIYLFRLRDVTKMI